MAVGMGVCIRNFNDCKITSVLPETTMDIV